MIQELRKLGSRPDKIARRLESLGHTGTRYTIDCPINSFLDGSNCVVSFGTVPFVLDLTDGEVYDVPPAILEVARRFDAGAYPYLERS